MIDDHLFQIGFLVGDEFDLDDDSWMSMVVLLSVNASLCSSFLVGVLFGRSYKKIQIKRKVLLEDRKKLYENMERDFLLDELS